MCVGGYDFEVFGVVYEVGVDVGWWWWWWGWFLGFVYGCYLEEIWIFVVEVYCVVRKVY